MLTGINPRYITAVYNIAVVYAIKEGWKVVLIVFQRFIRRKLLSVNKVKIGGIIVGFQVYNIFKSYKLVIAISTSDRCTSGRVLSLSLSVVVISARGGSSVLSTY